jgi:hypothetical protein
VWPKGKHQISISDGSVLWNGMQTPLPEQVANAHRTLYLQQLLE